MLDTAVIPCGGLGTRLHPITRWLAKEMLPVGLKPVLYWTLDEVASAGLQRAVIITNPRKPMLESAARQWQGPLELEFVPQTEAKGLGHALVCARDQLAGSAFAVVLPDNLFAGGNPTTQVLDTHRATRLPTVLLAEISRADAASKGATGKARVETAADGTLRVVDVAGKGRGRFDPGAGGTAVTPIGRFVLPGDVFAEFDDVARGLAPGEELDDVPVLQRYAWRGALAGVINAATFYDVGVPEGYRQAIVDFPASA